MKWVKDKRALLAGILAASILLSGCGSSGSSYSMDTAASTEMATTEITDVAEYEYDSTAEENGSSALGVGDLSDSLSTDQVSTGRKIIYTADADIETENFDEASAQIKSLLDEAGGYVSNTTQSGNAESGNRYASFTCRVPADQYQTFLDGLSGTGNLYYLYQYTDDVTSQYVDVEARITTLEQQRDRLRELAEEAEDIDTLLSIEDKLGDVQYELESYSAQMRSMENQLSYSTVSISLNEVRTVTEGTSFVSRMRSAFSDSWYNFVDGTQNVIIWFIYAIPVLLILGIIAAVIIVIAVRKHKKNREKIAARGTVTETYHAPGWDQISEKMETAETKKEDSKKETEDNRKP